jgi:hypothetical protein
VLRALEHCHNQQLRDLVEFFKIAIYSSPSDVPSFENVVQVPTIGTAAAPIPTIPAWLQDHVNLKPAGPSQQPQTTATSADQSWVLDFVLPPGPTPAFVNSVVLQRVLLYCSIVAAISAIFYAPLTMVLVSAGIMLVNLIVCIWGYTVEPAVGSRAQCRTNVRKAEAELASVRKAITEIEARMRDLRSAENEQVTKLTKEIQNILADEKKQREAADKVLRQATAPALEAKRRIDQQEAAEIQQLQNTIGNEVSSLAQQLNQSLHAESTERAFTLQKKQEEHVQRCLEREKITPGKIPGIGPHLTISLEGVGIRAAADCDYSKCLSHPAIGRKRAAALMVWKQGLEAQAKVNMPTGLSLQEDNAIKSKYATSRAQLEAQLLRAQLALKAQQAAVQEKYACSRIPFDSQIAAEKAKHSVEQQQIAEESKRGQEPLQATVLRTHREANEAVVEVQRDEAGHRQSLRSVQWRVAKAKVQSRRFEAVSFGHYARYVAIGN